MPASERSFLVTVKSFRWFSGEQLWFATSSLPPLAWRVSREGGREVEMAFLLVLCALHVGCVPVEVAVVSSSDVPLLSGISGSLGSCLLLLLLLVVVVVAVVALLFSSGAVSSSKCSSMTERGRLKRC